MGATLASERQCRGTPTGVCGRSPLDRHADYLLALVGEQPDLTLAKIRDRLQARAVRAGITSVWRFFDRHGVTFKKTLRAAEQDRPDVAVARRDWRAAQPALDARRLVFIDETATATNMVRSRDRSRRGRRLIGKVPHGHWKTTTFVAALRCDGLTAPFVVDGR